MNYQEIFEPSMSHHMFHVYGEGYRVLVSNISTQRVYGLWRDQDESQWNLVLLENVSIFFESSETSVAYSGSAVTVFDSSDTDTIPGSLAGLIYQIATSIKPGLKCADCNNLITEDHVSDSNRDQFGSFVCEECSNRYARCENCAGVAIAESMLHDLCEHCYREQYANCFRCDAETPRDETRGTFSGNTICHDCYEMYYFTCQSCNEIFSNTDHYRDGVCESCADSEDSDNESEDSLIHDYSYKPAPRFYGEGPLFLGVELEVNTRYASEDAEQVLGQMGQSHVYLKEDGSIGKGFEIVTHPHSYSEQRKLWESFFDDVPDEMTSYKSGRCGMHVHLTRSCFTEMHLRRLIVFLNAPENRTYVSSIAQRSSNDYSKIAEKKLDSPLSSDRYEAVNTTNRNTIEIRIFRGTVRKDRFFKNLEFTQAIFEFTQQSTYDRLNYQQFVDFVSVNRSRFRYLYNYHIEKRYQLGVPLKHTSEPVSEPIEDVAA